jgi:1-acyl-sn-glycerol-3-phosphate acyltransferase
MFNMHWVYYAGRLATKTVMLLCTRYRITGQENVPVDGPLLVVSNHLSVADPAILGAVIRRKMFFLAKEELFRTKYSSYFVRNYGALPIRRGGINRKALAEATEHLDRGCAVAMFPEGQRSRDLKLQPPFPGTARLAMHPGISILPVGITGTEVIKGAAWWLRRPRLTINIGQAFTPSVTLKPGKDAMRELSREIMERIAALLPPPYRGDYPGRSE